MRTEEYVNHVVVDGAWGDWGSWMNCNTDCGVAIQNRTRSCTNPTPQYGGTDCFGEDTLTQACNNHKCPSKLVEYVNTWIISIYLIS